MTEQIYKITRNGVLVAEEVKEKFETNNEVRRGCPLSPILFNIFINGLEKTLRKNNMGETALRSNSGAGLKVYALLYADDAALVAEDERELTSMLKTLKRLTDQNQMDVNLEKTKIMIFRNGGRRKSDSWKYKGENIEVVREFKYVDFWFTTQNQYSTNIKKAARKTPQLINKVWGETKRAGITDLRKRFFYVNSTVKAAAINGAELWGW